MFCRALIFSATIQHAGVESVIARRELASVAAMITVWNKIANPWIGSNHAIKN
jgi:hypothetical protein